MGLQSPFSIIIVTQEQLQLSSPAVTVAGHRFCCVFSHSVLLLPIGLSHPVCCCDLKCDPSGLNCHSFTVSAQIPDL